MECKPELTFRQLMHQLRSQDLVLAGKNKNQPIILYRYGRWHLITISSVVDDQWKAVRGIASVHFMTPTDARKTIHEWLPYSKVISFSEVSESFTHELSVKVLPCAEDYRPLVQNKLVEVAGGFTTDTLCLAKNEGSNDDELIKIIEEQMKSGQIGLFIYFSRTF